MSWVALRVVPGADRERALQALFDAGSTGVEEVGDVLVTHFPPGSNGGEIADAVRAASPGSSVDVGESPAVDWSEAWKAGVGAHRLGALTIAPPWLAAGHDPARTIVIEPGMAFGTGEHATTRSVLRLMQGLVHPGDRIADLGAGSAVLSIAAAKLGASRVTAIEIDPDAIGNAEENIARNGVADRVRLLDGDAAVLLPLIAPVELVLANILSSVLVALLPVVRAALVPGGRAVLSGLLVAERHDMLAHLASARWHVLGDEREEEWWTVAVTPA